MSIDVAPILEQLCARRDLEHGQARRLFAAVMQGAVDEVSLSAILVALKAKGETPAEIAGAAAAMREAALGIDAGAVADSCGTGGDGAQTVNISTAAALVATEAGVRMAKHGNRSISSRCGSADVLEQLGVVIDGDAAHARRCLEEVGICFLFAPRFHPGVRHAMAVRRQLGVRTLFNLLGPLANPASPRWQLMGVYDPARCRTMAETLAMLGCERALVVHGGGLDEVALHADTTAAWLEGGEVRELTLSPEQAGLSRCELGELRGGEPADNARWLEELLAGAGAEAHRAAVAINAGALMWVCGRAEDLRRGSEQALAILAEGKAAARLARWRELG